MSTLIDRDSRQIWLSSLFHILRLYLVLSRPFQGLPSWFTLPFSLSFHFHSYLLFSEISKVSLALPYVCGLLYFSNPSNLKFGHMWTLIKLSDLTTLYACIQCMLRNSEKLGRKNTRHQKSIKISVFLFLFGI